MLKFVEDENGHIIKAVQVIDDKDGEVENGMTIDDAILCLKGIKQYGRDTFTKRSQGDWQNSLDTAIETMRKYQKIEQIIDNWTKTEEIEWQIREVMENGSD